MLPVLLATNLNYLLFYINRCLIFFLIFCCPQTAGRNINNLRYADDTTFMAESEEELKSLLMKVKEKLNIQKTKIMTSGPITSWQIDWGESGNSDRFLFSWAPKSLQMVTAAMKLKDSCSLEEKL